MVQNMITIYTAAISLFLLDPFLVQQQRLRKRNITIQHMCSNPLRWQVQHERLHISHPNRGCLPYTKHQFNLFTKSDNWCLEFLRFTKAQIQELAQAFRLQDLHLQHCCQATPETCLAALLFRLAFPNRYKNFCDVCVFNSYFYLFFCILALFICTLTCLYLYNIYLLSFLCIFI